MTDIPAIARGADPTQEQVEAVARRLYKADTLDQNETTRPKLDLSSVDLDKWYDENAAMPLSGPGFVRRYEAMATAAIAAMRPWMREGWQSMDSAPRDRSYVLVKLRDDALQGGNFSHYAGRCFVAYHEGLTASGYDMGWGLFPGFGGVCDNQIAAWMPLPLYRGASHE